MNGPAPPSFSLSIPARAEYLILCRLAVAGLEAARGARRGVRRGPQARGHRGLHERRPARLPRRRRRLPSS